MPQSAADVMVRCRSSGARRLYRHHQRHRRNQNFACAIAQSREVGGRDGRRRSAKRENAVRVPLLILRVAVVVVAAVVVGVEMPVNDCRMVVVMMRRRLVLVHEWTGGSAELHREGDEQDGQQTLHV
jgi:hypothetical protein